MAPLRVDALKCVGNVDAAKLCAITQQLCIITGVDGGLLLRDLLYVYAPLAYGTIGGVEITAPNAPRQHAFSISRVVGFRPSQLDSRLGFGGYEGFSIQFERERSGFEVELLLRAAFADTPVALVVRNMLGQPGFENEMWVTS